MSEIGAVSSFIAEELSYAMEKDTILKNQIRSLELDIEFVEKAAEKIIEGKDDTAEVFLSSDSSKGFDELELEKLRLRKAELLKQLEQTRQELKENESKYQRLKGLLRDCQKLTGNDVQKVGDGFDFTSGNVNTIETLNLQERDRCRIAMDIHDTVIQNLTALTLKNSFIIKIMDSDRQRAQLELKSCNELLKESIGELRNIIFHLRPMSLDVLGFKDTLITMIDQFSSRTDMILTYDYWAEIEDLDSDFLINLIRIIQELCNNAIKHSGGSKLHIAVSSTDHAVDIRVEDDGVGFDGCGSKHGKGFGLSMIADRIKNYNGKFEAKRLPKGVQCHVMIPIKEKNND